MTTWTVMRAYLAGMPEHVDAPNIHALALKVQNIADAKRVRRDRPPIGTLVFEHMTDQVEVTFERNGRTIRFCTLMAAA